MQTVERAITIPAPPQDVWPAVSRSDDLSTWFGAEVELDARPGGRGVFRWLPFQRTPEGEAVTVPSTRVEITLDAVPEGTLVRVVEQPAFPLPATLQTRAAATALTAIEA